MCSTRSTSLASFTHDARPTSLLVACIDLLQNHVFVFPGMIRFYDTLGGEILLNGRNIKEFNVRWLRSLVRSLGLSPCVSAYQPISLSVYQRLSL